MRDEQTVQVGGRELRITNRGKLFFPADGITKGDLIDYYAQIAPVLLPYLKHRPLALKRYPEGITGKAFFQKESHGALPEWLRCYSPERGRSYFCCEDEAALLALVNLGCIDHNAWMSRFESILSPDYILIDLDPFECPFARIVMAAQHVHRLLDEIGLESYPKTSGGDGLHICIPIAPGYTFKMVQQFVQILATMLASQYPDLFTTPRARESRKPGMVYFDYLQIAPGKTIASPYSVRGYPGAPVSMPLKWTEVNARLTAGKFNLRNALSRLKKEGDLFAPVLHGEQKIEDAVEGLRKLT